MQKLSFQESPEPVEGPRIIPPPPDILPVIDKMASYVAKNGPAFEYVVKNKGDSRFDFVHSWHQHNPYYEFRKRVYTEVRGFLQSLFLLSISFLNFSVLCCVLSCV